MRTRNLHFNTISRSSKEEDIAKVTIRETMCYGGFINKFERILENFNKLNRLKSVSFLSSYLKSFIGMSA